MATVQASFTDEMALAIRAAKEAAAAVRQLYERSAAATYVKGDGSPVTDADLVSDRIIRQAISSTYPDDAILTEEGADDQERLNTARCWIVDPIDGTQQFIDRTGEFDILISLIVDGRPIVGVSIQPATGLLLAATGGGGAWVERGGQLTPVRLRPPEANIRLATSVWLGAPASMPVLVRVAQRLGTAPPDVSRLGVYTRSFLPPDNKYDALIGFGITETETMGSEWDVAVTDLVVHEAGGRMTDLTGQFLRYNKPIPKNVGGLVLAVDPKTHEQLLVAIAPELATQKSHAFEQSHP